MTAEPAVRDLDAAVTPDDLFSVMNAGGAARCVALSDPGSGLRAFVVLDDLTLGPAAGGVRTRRYRTAAHALTDAIELARAMTVKCALAGLAAGGGKAVVLEHDSMRRPVAFARLGRFVEELGGVFRTAGDLGTTEADLEAMARETRYVHRDDGALSAAAGRGLLRAAEACAEVAGRPGIAGLRVGVQGCGTIGAAAARALAGAGAALVVADLDAPRAASLAREIGGEVVDADTILSAPVDIVLPCATGHAVTSAVARSVRAWAVCAGANNALGDEGAEDELMRRDVLFVPDVIASAGAVVEGIGASLMGLDDRSALIDRIGLTCRHVLHEARDTGRRPTVVAEAHARARIAAARDDSA